MKKSKFGFSLIELSVVILIIGILVIGITKGSRIMREAKLKSARSLTSSSPVNIYSDDVALWLETTMEKSIDASEALNNTAVSNWYNIKNNPDDLPLVTQAGGARPLYITGAVNGLPTLRFDGSDDRFTRTNVLGNILSTDGRQITIFVVQKYYRPAHYSSILFWGTVGVDRINIHAPSFDGITSFDFGICCTTAGRLTYTPAASYYNQFVILSMVRRPSGYAAIRVNGIEKQSTTVMTDSVNVGLITDLHISGGAPSGWGDPYNQHGDISEIIIIKKGLKTTEMADIEKYLSQKWGIPLK